MAKRKLTKQRKIVYKTLPTQKSKD